MVCNCFFSIWCVRWIVFNFHSSFWCSSVHFITKIKSGTLAKKFSWCASNAKNPSCFFPIPQAASCITRLIEKVEAPVLYLSTDAAESETGLLQSLLILNGKTVPLVKRPARDSAEKWDALLYRHGLEGDSQVCFLSSFVLNELIHMPTK